MVYVLRSSDWCLDVCSSVLIDVVKSEKSVFFIRFVRWYFTLGYFAEQAVVAHEGLIDDVRIGAGWPFRSGRIRLRGVPVPPTPVRAAVRSGLEPPCSGTRGRRFPPRYGRACCLWPP